MREIKFKHRPDPSKNMNVLKVEEKWAGREVVQWNGYVMMVAQERAIISLVVCGKHTHTHQILKSRIILFTQTESRFKQKMWSLNSSTKSDQFILLTLSKKKKKTGGFYKLQQRSKVCHLSFYLLSLRKMLVRCLCMPVSTHKNQKVFTVLSWHKICKLRTECNL